MTKGSSTAQDKKPKVTIDDLPEQSSYDEHLDDLNAHTEDPKAALNLAKKKLKAAVKAEQSLRQRFRDLQGVVEERDQQIETLQTEHKAQLEAVEVRAKEAEERFKTLDTEYGDLTLRANLIAEGVDPDRLEQAVRLIDHPSYFKEVDGKREYNFDAFKEDNDNIFFDEPVNPFEQKETDEPTNQKKERSNSVTEVDEDDLEPDDDEPGDEDDELDDEPKSRPFVRQRGSSVETTTLDQAKNLINNRYTKPTFKNGE